MSDKAHSESATRDKTNEENARARSVLQTFAAKAGSSRWTVTLVLAFACVAIVLGGNIAAPYLFAGATLEGAVAGQLRTTAGLTFKTGVSGRFDLLPRPHLVFYKTSVADSSGMIDLYADEFDSDVRLLPLIVGHIEMSSITLFKPRLAIDLDVGPLHGESYIGRAMQTREPHADQPLGTVTLLDGTATIKSKTLRHEAELSDVNVTLDWRDLDAAATLSGSLSLQGTAAEITAWIAKPSSLMRGDHSAVSFRLNSTPLDISTTGDLISATSTAFRGHATAKSPSVAALLELAGSRTPLLAPFANLSLDSDAAIGIDPENVTSIDLQNLSLRADGNAYEGTLAFQSGPRPFLSGTLDTQQLTLAPFLSRMSALRRPDGGWSQARLVGAPISPLDLDLRISAGHVRVAPITIDDAALAVITRAERTEVGLVEGKAYGGTAKGRVSIGVADDEVTLRATGSLTGADAATLSWDEFGRQIAEGTVSASIDAEASGNSVADLMRNLQGWAKGSASDGEIIGLDIGKALEASRRGDVGGVSSALHGGRTPFGTLTMHTRIVDGVASLDGTTATTAGAPVSLAGNADLGARRLDLRVVATPPSGAATRNAAIPPLALRLQGSFDKVGVRPAMGDRR